MYLEHLHNNAAFGRSRKAKCFPGRGCSNNAESLRKYRPRDHFLDSGVGGAVTVTSQTL